jgi:outer membrane lipoprotein
MKRFFILVMVLGLLTGCTHVISRASLKQVDTNVTFSALLKDPHAYVGKVVLLGGVIVDAINKKEGTELEICQTELDQEGKPVNTDRSKGRFLALYPGFLDNMIYRMGREVTLTGTVVGGKIQPLGEIQYVYPYLFVKELHLFKQEEYVSYDPYDVYLWGGWWYPWGPWGYYPWGWGFHEGHEGHGGHGGGGHGHH